MSIRYRLLFLFGTTLMLLAAIAIYSSWVYRNSFAVADQIRESGQRTVDAAREAQAFFRAEVVAWKNVMLGDQEGDQYHDDLGSFYTAERRTRDALQRLLEDSEGVPDVHGPVGELMGVYRALRCTGCPARRAISCSAWDFSWAASESLTQCCTYPSIWGGSPRPRPWSKPAGMVSASSGTSPATSFLSSWAWDV